MKKEIKLDEVLLSLILAMQSASKHQSNLNKLWGTAAKIDPEDAAMDVLKSMPDTLLAIYGLKKNKLSFERLFYYPVTEEVLSTPSEELGQFALKNYAKVGEVWEVVLFTENVDGNIVTHEFRALHAFIDDFESEDDTTAMELPSWDDRVVWAYVYGKNVSCANSNGRNETVEEFFKKTKEAFKKNDDEQ